MRFIHTSDWHLGQYFYGKSRAAEHQKFLDWLVVQAKENKADAIIIAGDIFDTSTPPSYAREMYFSFISQMQLLDCQLIILAGNHDSVAMLGESQSLLASIATQVVTHVSSSYLSALGDKVNKGVFAIKDKQGVTLAVLCAIPFIRPRDVIKSRAGQSAADKQKNLQQAISEHYQELYLQAKLLADTIEIQQGEAVPIIATGHLTALGVSMTDTKSDAVRDIYIGSLEAFPSSAFPPADYIALGHIHRAQKVAKTEHIRYCGSPIALSFDEVKQDKRVLLVDFCKNNLTSVTDIMVPCFQSLVMVKTTMSTLAVDLHKAAEELIQSSSLGQLPGQSHQFEQPKAWLDIEIENSDYLTDLAQRVNDLIVDLPVEVLLVRRSKKARQLLQQSAKENNATLSELTLSEVFDSRLSELTWPNDEELERKQRLKILFQQTVSQLESEEGTQ